MNYQNESSELRLYSLGYVVEDYVEDSPLIKVVPIEIISDIDGNLGDVDKETNKNVNIENENKVTIKTKDTVIIAKWFNLSSSNRITSPNVCKGETVRIYKYADTDKYYWATLYDEIDLRKREKVVYGISNRDSIEEPVDIDNMYYFTYDSINKMMRLHTPDNNNEYTTYDVEINTEDGLLTIIDGKQNFIELDSQKDKLTVTINKDIEMNAPNITMNSKKHTINTTDYILNASNSKTVKTTTYKLNASTSTLTTNININGNVASQGKFSSNGQDISDQHYHTGNLGVPTSGSKPSA